MQTEETQVTIGNVHSEVTLDALKDFLQHFGDVVSVSTVDFDPLTNTRVIRAKFASAESAKEALGVEGIPLLEKPLTVRLGTEVPPPVTGTQPPPPNPIPFLTSEKGPESDSDSDDEAKEGAGKEKGTGLDSDKTEEKVGEPEAKRPALGPLAAAPKIGMGQQAAAGRMRAAQGIGASLQDDEEVKCSVYISNLFYDLRSDALIEKLSVCGPVIRCLLGDESAGAPTQFAFVQFADIKSVIPAINMTGKLLHGRAMFIEQATEKVPIQMPSMQPLISPGYGSRTEAEALKAFRERVRRVNERIEENRRKEEGSHHHHHHHHHHSSHDKGKHSHRSHSKSSRKH